MIEPWLNVVIHPSVRRKVLASLEVLSLRENVVEGARTDPLRRIDEVLLRRRHLAEGGNQADPAFR